MTDKLTPEEEEFVRVARKLAEERAARAQNPGVTAAHPDKFSAPIGMDDDGNLFPAKAPDLRGFDEYTPTTTNVRSIWDTVRGKVESGHATKIALELSNSRVDVAKLAQQFAESPIAGLEQVVVVRDSQVTRLWP